jgi:hypothetical protein
MYFTTPSKDINMRIVSSQSVSHVSRYHRALTMVFAALEIEWGDIGIREDWSSSLIAKTLKNHIETYPKPLRSCPGFATNRLRDRATHPLHGFPTLYLRSITDLFCRSHRQGWSHAKLLGACTAICLKDLCQQDKPVVKTCRDGPSCVTCSRCSRAFVSKISLRLHETSCGGFLGDQLKEPTEVR